MGLSTARLLLLGCSTLAVTRSQDKASLQLSEEQAVRHLDAAAWAANLVPKACDRRGSGCDWLSVAPTWRYVWNNVRLAAQAPASRRSCRSRSLGIRDARRDYTKSTWPHPRTYRPPWRRPRPVVCELAPGRHCIPRGGECFDRDTTAGKVGGEATRHKDLSSGAVGAVSQGDFALRSQQPPASRHAGVLRTGDQRNTPPIASPQRYKETAVLPGARRLDLTEFEMLDLIDETPMSAVYRLRHRRTGITVAGKRIQKGCDVHRSGDYLNEVQMLHSLAKSPYIVSLHGISDSEREFWTVMELCAGGRLSEWLGRYANTAKTVVQQLLEAVSHLHSRLICHLDIKPDNVLLSGSGEVRLCDFVTACQLQQADQQLSGKCGTVGFRAPEVESGGAYSGLKADVYSLGQTLQIQELRTVRIGWPELEEILPYMTKPESLDRPEIKKVQEHLTAGSQGRRQLDWSSQESITYQQLLAENSLEPCVMAGKAAPPKDRDSVQRPRATGLRAAEAGPATKACHSSYCRRSGSDCDKNYEQLLNRIYSLRTERWQGAVKPPSNSRDLEERRQHGLRFAGGRSLQVTPHSSVAVGQLKVPPIGAAVASAREAALALESGIRMLFLIEATVYLVHEVLRVLDSVGLDRHEVIIVGRIQAADVKGVDASSVVSHLDAAALAFQEESSEKDVEVWQQFEASMRGAVSAVGVSEMPPERLKTFLLRGSRPEFVQTTFTVYEPGGPDEARRQSSQMEELLAAGIVTMGSGLSQEGGCGYLRPLNDPHISAVALRANRSCGQVIDRWFMQLGGVVLVNATQRSEFLEHVASLEFALSEAEMRKINGLSSLVASSPGRRAPAWCEDVYHLSDLPLEV
eukprot:s153_g19.t1